MSTFADYTYYQEHGGTLSQSAYNAVVDDAHAEILSQTSGQALSAPDAMQDAVKLCECKLVDAIVDYNKGASLLPKGIGSISNDGYSVSLGAGAANPLKARAQELHAICARYLQYPCNLMCGWL